MENGRVTSPEMEVLSVPPEGRTPVEGRQSNRRRSTIMQTLVRESDRGAVLVTTAVVHESLAEALTAWLAPSTGTRRKSVDALVRAPGPLSSLWARSQMALAAGVIDDWAFDAINCLRELRNDCADRHAEISFADSGIGDRARRMFGIVAAAVPDKDGCLQSQTATRMLPLPEELAKQRAVSHTHAVTLLGFVYAASSLIGYLDGLVDSL